MDCLEYILESVAAAANTPKSHCFAVHVVQVAATVDDTAAVAVDTAKPPYTLFLFQNKRLLDHSLSRRSRSFYFSRL